MAALIHNSSLLYSGLAPAWQDRWQTRSPGHKLREQVSLSVSWRLRWLRMADKAEQEGDWEDRRRSTAKISVYALRASPLGEVSVRIEDIFGSEEFDLRHGTQSWSSISVFTFSLWVVLMIPWGVVWKCDESHFETGLCCIIHIDFSNYKTNCCWCSC